MGGRSSTRSDTQTSQTTNATTTGLQDTEGVAVAGGGDVNVEVQTTDLGAIQGAFDFSDQFTSSAFQFANDVSNQAAELSERAIETSQGALATVVTGGQSDLSKIDGKTIGIAVAGVVAIIVLPKLIKGA